MRAEPIVLRRGCTAVAIPSGEPLALRAGSAVVISQSLGGAFTVMTEEGLLARIAPADADALGRGQSAPEGGLDDLPLAERVQAELKTVYDPEIPVDIVELGLVYGTELTDLPDGRKRVHVTMTMTAPGCGMGDFIRTEVLEKLQALPQVGEVHVEIVLDPPWNPGRMSEAARLTTGIMW